MNKTKIDRKRGRPKGSKNKNKCNCDEWAELGSYICPVHGHYNIYRRYNPCYIFGGK